MNDASMSFAEQKFEDALELHQRGDLAGAEKTYRAVVECQPDNPNAAYLLGKVKGMRGDTAEAIAWFRKACALRPHNADFVLALANALHQAGACDEAAAQYKNVLALKPDSAEAYVRLGDLFRVLGNFDAAARSYRFAIRYDARNYHAFTNFGNILRMDGRYTEALEYYRQALRVKPDFPKALNNLALCLTDQGDLDEAERTYRHAIKLQPGFAELRSNLLFCLCYRPGYDYRALFDEHCEFGRKLGVAESKRYHTWNITRDPDRRLRLGYVSPDFRTHSVAYFIESLLAHHDPQEFEVVCYSHVEFEDETTARFKKHAQRWHRTCGMSDDELAAAVHRDGIDILVDLAGHTGGNRLVAFSYKPSPLQFTYLGYPNTTGLDTIDYRITDACADAQGEDEYYTEKLFRLDGCFLCYTPPRDAPDAARARDGGAQIMLGSFNTLSKLNPQVIALWSQILHAIPGARLLLKRRALNDPGTRDRIVALFESNGIDRGRLELLDHVETTHDHLALYNRIDICLDTFPYNGTTTTCEALWMGVAVVTLAGAHHAQRVSLSILHALGIEELVARSHEEYIERVCSLAADRGRLGEFRSTMRDRMAKSPLCDARGFTRRFEAALRGAWRAWCSQ